LSSHSSLAVVLLTSAVYFFVHELVIGDYLIAVKYSALLLMMFLALGIRQDYYFIFKVMAVVGSVVSLSIVFQQALVLLAYQGDLSSFNIAIPGNEIGRRVNCNFVNPYMLGYFEVCASDQKSMIDFQFNRSLSFSREPKYISSVLLFTMAFSLISRISKSWKIIVSAIHVFALLFVMSYTAFAVLIASFFLLYFRISSFIYTMIAFILPLTLLPLLIELLLQIFDSGMVNLRLQSASVSIGEGLSSTSFTLLGSGVTPYLRHVQDSILYKIYGQYGIIAFFLTIMIFYFTIKPALIFNSSRHKDYLISYGLLILVNSILFYNLYFFADIFNFYFMSAMTALLFVPYRKHLQSGRLFHVKRL